MSTSNVSLLCPSNIEPEYKALSELSIHDLGLDVLCESLSDKVKEQKMILYIMSHLSAKPEVAAYRLEVFEDIKKYPKLREEMMTLLDAVSFLKEFGSFKREFDDEYSAWDLLHRLDEIKDYIKSVEGIYDCLNKYDLKSQGLLNLKKYVSDLYNDSGFEELKKDIAKITFSASEIKSVTVGINLNDRFEAHGIGLISVNNKYFSKANVLGNFTDFLLAKDNIKNSSDWDGNMKYHEMTGDISKNMESLERFNRLNAMRFSPIAAIGFAGVPEADTSRDITRYLDKASNHMIGQTVKKLKEILGKYVTLSIMDIIELIPEFIYYIRWAEKIEALESNGMRFGKAYVATEPNELERRVMRAKGIYNLKLAFFETEEHKNIVANDLDFDTEHRVYILTGANRGGKTTITQAIGQLFVLAQGGINIPGDTFIFTPVDNIFTHFPADEDKTMDLGRLGEECKRFKELYAECTKDSLLLLNETFSTTSFEEGYVIAKDAIKAILSRGTRCIYNTHMHKLGMEIEEFNAMDYEDKASSLIVESKEGQRSYRVCIAPPEGLSYAKDIAEKYGVTFEMLTCGK